jgi:hypothetical protein
MALSYVELQAWAVLTGRRPLAWEIGWLKLIDRAWLSVPAAKEPDR